MARKEAGGKSSQQNDFLEPKKPVIDSVVNVGTDAPFGNGQATLTISLPAGSPPQDTFDITATPTGGGDAVTGSAAESPATIGGLGSDVEYTFTVIATNAAGSSEASDASSAVTITTVPDAPAAPTVTTQDPGPNDDVSWTAPANGGSAITTYYWESDDEKSGSTTDLAIVVAQEENTSQAYRVRAENANGLGEWYGS